MYVAKICSVCLTIQADDFHTRSERTHMASVLDKSGNSSAKEI